VVKQPHCSPDESEQSPTKFVRFSLRLANARTDFFADHPQIIRKICGYFAAILRLRNHKDPQVLHPKQLTIFGG
jgi:hypothetical protein